jgi:ribonuclease HII
MKSAAVGVGIADVERIDRDNILRASLWAMTEAVKALGTRPAFALVDGNMLPELDCAGEAIVDGDALCVSIAAASIIAKVTRDRIMRELGLQYPLYGFEQHKGYSTEAHLIALKDHGPTPCHRRSFAPVANWESLTIELESDSRFEAGDSP